jgi:hypothetical protein
VTGTDVEYFNNNLRRWYTASSNNVVLTDSCQNDGAGHVPVVGVFAAPGSFVEADCSALNGHGLGVDSIHNNVYVGSRRFPAGTANPDGAGVLVFHDHSALAQPGLMPETHASISGTAKGIVHFEEGHVAEARLSGLPASSTILLNVTTTVGNETLTCTESFTSATCHGTLLGKALIGGEVIASANGLVVASGPITNGNGGFGKGGNSE